MTWRAPPTSSSPAKAMSAEARRIEESAVSIIRAVRRALDAGHFSPDDAVDLALVPLMRGAPGSKLTADKRASLRAALGKLAKALDPSQPRSVLAFARAASQAAWSLVNVGRHPGSAIAERAADIPVRELARAALYAEGTSAGDPELHVQRAVTRALRERRRSRGQKRIPLEDGDPLRVVLDVPSRGDVRLPRNDVRMRLADAAHDNVAFGDALRQAAKFSQELLRPVLGEELWSLGKPTGFSDKKETRVIVEVPSAMHAHEMQLRSQELIHRLKRVKGFERVAAVKLVVVEAATIPILQPKTRT